MDINLIIKGNKIFDGISNEPFSGIIAVSKNKIVKVIKNGNEDDLQSLLKPSKTTPEIIEAYDKLVMAGFHDNHVHLIMAGMFREYPNLINCRSAEECAELVNNAIERNKSNKDGKSWIIGFQWYHVFWDEPTLPTKEILDKFFPDRPVFLLNAEAHGAWVNSKALEICSITKETKDPFGGIIVRDDTGEPTGILLENAASLVTKDALVFPPEREKELILSFMKGAKEYGITSITDVQPYFHGNMGNLSVYSEMDKAGEFLCRVHVAPDLLGDLDEITRQRDAYNSDKLKISHAKQFLDGVFTTHTALVIDEYNDEPGNHGISLFNLEGIKKAVPEAHKRGLSIKLHCLGDKATKMALDYFTEAINLHGKNNCRHAIEHCELVAEEDIKRFGELGVIPSVQPEHIALTQIYSENPYPFVLGRERAWQTWRLRDLLSSAGVMAFGSDCPVVDNNPFLELFRATTRVHNDGEPKGGQNPSQKLTLSESLRAYTSGSAYSVGREKELGTLEEGKFADIVIIDRNLFDIPEKEFFNSKVDTTIFDGKVVYSQNEK